MCDCDSRIKLGGVKSNKNEVTRKHTKRRRHTKRRTMTTGNKGKKNQKREK